jgi:hypothetical protein
LESKPLNPRRREGRKLRDTTIREPGWTHPGVYDVADEKFKFPNIHNSFKEDRADGQRIGNSRQ